MSKTFENLFLSVGAMKAGTTWLFAMLRRHPQLCFTVEKELHYFHHREIDDQFLSTRYRHERAERKYVRLLGGDDSLPERKTSRLMRLVNRFRGPGADLPLDHLSADDRAWVAHYLSDPVDDAWFNGLFPDAGSDRYICDFSNLAAQLSADSWRNIAARTRRLRVLYTLRDPVQRLWSHTKFNLEMTDQLHLLKNWKPADYEAYARSPGIWENGEYGMICDRLRGVLPEESLRFQFHEDMKAQPLQTLRGIEGFLQVAPFDYPDWLLDRRPTRSANLPMPDFYPALFASDVARIKGELRDLGHCLPASWG